MTVVTVTLNPCIDQTFSVERIVADRKLAGEDVREYPGGGGINVARVISRLGGDVHALWSCGGDTGGRLAQLLDSERVPHTPIPIGGKVRVNLIITDASSGEQYRFGMPGPVLTEEEHARWLDALGRLPSSVRYLALSGSLPGGVSVEAYAELLRAVPGGIRVIVDTKKDALRQAFATGVYLVKPNLNELGEVAGRELTDDEQIERAAREIIEFPAEFPGEFPGERRGAKVVLVSLGRAGALLVTADSIERFSTPAVPVRSKVGAGDSMIGGLLAALDQGRPLNEAVRVGVAAGAAAVMRHGTELCRREDVERLYPSVRRQELSQ
jgi:6-phosphofructokinase 2